jgi:hypothetical protein
MAESSDAITGKFDFYDISGIPNSRASFSWSAVPAFWFDQRHVAPHKR